MAPSPSDLYADILRGDLTAFIHRSFQELNPGESFAVNWHIELMAAKLEEVRLGRCKRLIICLPPRHTKSFVGSIAFPAWCLGHEPSTHIMCVSYVQDLADKFARQCRALIDSPFYRSLFSTRLSAERNAVAEFETTQGGSRIATSVGGAVTGRGGNIIIIDDFLKPEDALSDARRGNSNAWYDSTLRSRLNRPGKDSFVILNQRLHTDDIIAHVQQEEGWEVLSLPAIAEEPERHSFMTPFGRRVIHRKIGEMLHPARLSRTELESQRRTMSKHEFAAQYQQDPQPPFGLIVQRKWLKFYCDRDKPGHFDTILQSWDTATKLTELSDYSVCTTWGLKGRLIYLLDVFRHRLEFPELKRKVAQLADLWNSRIVLVEDKSSGTQLIQELRNDGFSQLQAAPSLDGDKVMRLRAQTAKIEGGFVCFPVEAHWLEDYLNELLSFPNSKFDDQVDSTVFALAWSSLNQTFDWTEECQKNFSKFIEAMAFDRCFYGF
jgi:predicted phage terminase large subunit-like protein